MTDMEDFELQGSARPRNYPEEFPPIEQLREEEELARRTMQEADGTIEVVSIKFRNRGKTYFFDPAGTRLENGTAVIVETSKGLELGDVVLKNHNIAVRSVVQPLRPVVRRATREDERMAARCRQREREAYVICKRKIEEHGLEMKLVDVECSFEGNKILFFFSSDGRVDFRELVKDLASVFHTRIELRQIGVRDEARMLGGLGICGRPFCCGSFLEEFQPVSTKMAKVQSMSLNPAKISGTCGRLMCCLRYEQEAYEELVKKVPKNGAFVETPDGYGNVTQVNILRQYVKVKLDGMGDDTIRTYDAEDIAAIPGGRPRDGSQPPHILVRRPKAPEPEESVPVSVPVLPKAPEDASKPFQRPKGKRDTPHDHPPKKPFKSKAAPGEPGSEEKPVRNGNDHGHRPFKNNKPQNRPTPETTEPGGDTQKPTGKEGYRKKNPNYRPHYRPRPKSGGEGGKSHGA